MFLNKTKNFDWNNFKPDGLGPKNLIILEWDKFCKVSLLHIYMFVYSFCADRKKNSRGCWWCLFESLNFQEEGSDEPLDPRLQLPMGPFSTNKYKFKLKGQVKSNPWWIRMNGCKLKEYKNVQGLNSVDFGLCLFKCFRKAPPVECR